MCFGYILHSLFQIIFLRNNIMFVVADTTAIQSKTALYQEIAQQANALLFDEPDMIANMANLSSLLWSMLPDINWVGFYINRSTESKQELVLGPFHGKPACVRIAFARGVCGHCATTRQTVIVEDVEVFPGHIACDSASRSEIVLPILAGDQLIAVLDIDSPVHARFDQDDQQGLERVVEIFTQNTVLV
jgi:L-methionine (R)-S-oxide reductase